MNKVLEYTRLVAFFVAALVGIQVPGFVDQYGKSLTAHTIESRNSLSQFQGDADRYFAGDLQRLVEHYQGHDDPVFIAGGGSISALMQRNAVLEAALAEFTSSHYSPYAHLVFTPVPTIRDHVWANYSYSVLLNAQAITFGAVFALLICMLVDLLMATLGVLLRSLFPSLGRRRRVSR